MPYCGLISCCHFALTYRLQCNQTKRDNYSQVPRPSVYLYGLRGGVSVAKAKGAEEALEGSPYSNWCKVYRFVDSSKVDLTLPAGDHFCGTNSETGAPMY